MNRFLLVSSLVLLPLTSFSQTVVSGAEIAAIPGSVEKVNIKEYYGVKLGDNPIFDYANTDDGYVMFDVKAAVADTYIFKAFIGTGNEGPRDCRVGPVDENKNFIASVETREIAPGTSGSNWTSGAKYYEWKYELKADTVYTFKVDYDRKDYRYGINLYDMEVVSGSYVAPKVLAFPGAEGAGRYTTGGRGGKIYKVTNLNDSGPGSLREAVEATGKRIVVFEVAGLISLESPLGINNKDITILGQTAPGDGICLKNYSIYVNTSNVIIRYIRNRMGDEKNYEDDAITGRYQSDIIIDHCSFSWCIDECASMYSNENFTMQWSTICESLNASVHQKENHGYGGLWGGTPGSFHHNLMIHHSSRTPRLTGGDPETELVDLTNNVFYNWGPGHGSYGGTGGNFNFINNYYKPGPSTAQKSHIVTRLIYTGPRDEPEEDGTYVWGKFHLSGNYFDTSCKYLSSSQRTEAQKVTEDNYLGMQLTTNLNLPGGTKEGVISRTAFEVAPVTTHTPQIAYNKVLKYAGACLSKDSQDIRYAEETLNGNFTYKGSNGSTLGIIDSQNDTEGWDNYSCTQAQLDRILDTDGDGIPDYWEVNNDLDPSNPNDEEYSLSKDYMNIEVYANSLVAHITRACLSLDDESTPVASVSKENVEVTVTVNGINVKGAVAIQLYSCTGVLVSAVNSEFIDIHGLPEGVYIVRAVTGNNKVVARKVYL